MTTIAGSRSSSPELELTSPHHRSRSPYQDRRSRDRSRDRRSHYKDNNRSPDDKGIGFLLV